MRSVSKSWISCTHDIKVGATVKGLHYDDHAQLRTRLERSFATYNICCPLNTVKGLAPYEFISKRWTTEPERFKLNSKIDQMPGLPKAASL